MAHLSSEDYKFIASQIIPDTGGKWWEEGSVYARVVLTALLERTTQTDEIYRLLDSPLVEIEKVLIGSPAEGLIDHRYASMSSVILNIIREHVQVTTCTTSSIN